MAQNTGTFKNLLPECSTLRETNECSGATKNYYVDFFKYDCWKKITCLLWTVKLVWKTNYTTF